MLRKTFVSLETSLKGTVPQEKWIIKTIGKFVYPYIYVLVQYTQHSNADRILVRLKWQETKIVIAKIIDNTIAISEISETKNKK